MKAVYLLGPGIPLLIYAALAFVLDTGTGGWDGVHYAEGAFAWLDNFPHLGETHWALRHPLVLPMFASMWLFGPSVFAAVLPNLIYGAALILVSYHFAADVFGRRTGFLFSLLVAVSPSLVLEPLQIEIRGPEVFFAALALWLFWRNATGSSTTLRSYVLAGLLAGVSWLCRESAGYLFPTLLLVATFATCHGHRPKAIAGTVLGFVSVIICELVVYSIVAGDMLYRYKIDLGHGQNPDENGLGADFLRADYIDLLLEPFQKAFFNDVPGALALVAVAATAYLFWRRTRFSRPQRQVLYLFGFAGAVSFLFSSMLLSLEIPRYYPMLAYAGCLMTATALGNLVDRRGLHWILTLGIGIAIFGAVLSDHRAGYSKRVVHAAADLAERINEPIFASPWLHERIVTELRFRGMTDQAASASVVSSETPTVGTLVLHSTFDDYYQPQATWHVEDREAVPIKLSHRILKKIVPTAILPSDIAGLTTLEVIIYRTR